MKENHHKNKSMWIGDCPNSYFVKIEKPIFNVPQVGRDNTTITSMVRLLYSRTIYELCGHFRRFWKLMDVQKEVGHRFSPFLNVKTSRTLQYFQELFTTWKYNSEEFYPSRMQNSQPNAVHLKLRLQKSMSKRKCFRKKFIFTDEEFIFNFHQRQYWVH